MLYDSNTNKLTMKPTQEGELVIYVKIEDEDGNSKFDAL